jgi:hypothetical protein
MVCISYLEISGRPAALHYLVRRLRERIPGMPIPVGLWPSEDTVLKDDRVRAVIGADYFTTSPREALEEILRRSRPPEGRRGRRLSGDCIGRPTRLGPADAIGRRSVFRIWSELFERVSEERIIWDSWSGMRAEIGLAMIGRSNINRMLTLRAAR